MTSKEAQKILSDYGQSVSRADAKSYEIKKLISSREFLDALRLDGIGGCEKASAELKVASDMINAVIARYGRMISSKTTDLNEYSKKCETAEKLLAALDPTSEKLLRLRYVDRKSWVAISLAMNYSERQCFYIHKKALGEFIEKWEETASVREKAKPLEKAEDI